MLEQYQFKFLRLHVESLCYSLKPIIGSYISLSIRSLSSVPRRTMKGLALGFVLEFVGFRVALRLLERPRCSEFNLVVSFTVVSGEPAVPTSSGLDGFFMYLVMRDGQFKLYMSLLECTCSHSLHLNLKSSGMNILSCLVNESRFLHRNKAPHLSGHFFLLVPFIRPGDVSRTVATKDLSTRIIYVTKSFR